VLGILRLRCAQSGNVFAILVPPLLLTHDEYVNDIAINNFAEGAGAERSLHTHMATRHVSLVTLCIIDPRNSASGITARLVPLRTVASDAGTLRCDLTMDRFVSPHRVSGESCFPKLTMWVEKGLLSLSRTRPREGESRYKQPRLACCA
jgi:hypothetical protein